MSKSECSLQGDKCKTFLWWHKCLKSVKHTCRLDACKQQAATKTFEGIVLNYCIAQQQHANLLHSIRYCDCFHAAPHCAVSWSNRHQKAIFMVQDMRKPRSQCGTYACEGSCIVARSQDAQIKIFKACCVHI